MTCESRSAWGAWIDVYLQRQKIPDIIAAEIAKTSETAREFIESAKLDVYAANYNGALHSINGQLDVAVNWAKHSKNTLRGLLAENATNFTKIAYRRLGQNKPIVNRLQNELAQAIILGEGIPKISRRIKSVADMSFKRARTIARTETLRASNEGRMLGFRQAEELGIELEREWVATLDARTRLDHGEMDGVKVEQNEPFTMPNGDEMMFPLDGSLGAKAENIVNCRCTYVAVVKNSSWGAEDEEIRENALTNAAENGIMGVGGEEVDENISGAVSGALNPDSSEAQKHAAQYYKAVRKMKTDVGKIAENTGISNHDIQEIKNYLFIDKHDLIKGSERFDESYDIAQSWQRLIDGKSIKEQDIILLNHEMLEIKLVKNGATQNQAHIEATKQFNYAKSTDERR